jgi:hypothetical protein
MKPDSKAILKPDFELDLILSVLFPDAWDPHGSE